MADEQADAAAAVAATETVEADIENAPAATVPLTVVSGVLNLALSDGTNVTLDVTPTTEPAADAPAS